MPILLEAIQRFAEPQEVSNSIMILVVGCNGLASNFLGMVLLQWHEKPELYGLPDQQRTIIQEPSQHAHVGPPHDLAPGCHYKPVNHTQSVEIVGMAPKSNHTSRTHRFRLRLKNGLNLWIYLYTCKATAVQEMAKSQNLNMKGVFLHVLGDAVGKIGVIASGLFV
ncbi:uncharacterized protein Z519_06595 [Cladophialophora bantiana CBS 173.52]|uniref:Cation efflux protein transmembrane domain-containing protein n=1 Tax=Cladophialophora bantiana (strain ATCC 10958 / CBS 173.52 / CDC B-1940 / NIH 8579) TaxID=1442370 RepID=A0A0D2G1Y4_CLAB1|nr:uncharacterized protein Z519_06595 [Cladophialophora bantiana CBS 173.52]KIW92747.1 hypothetical protein Z519_06595 [Cladophialophora bantiana CBS 173.52]